MMTAGVHYQLQLSDIAAHIVEVQLKFIPLARQQIVSLPAWIPGSYMIRDFARNITAIAASDADGPISVQQLDKQRWQLDCGSNEVTLCYQVYAYDLSVRAAYIDDEVAVLNPACLCLEVAGLQSSPHQVFIVKPSAPVCDNWQLATALIPEPDVPRFGFGRYNAANYQQLIDSPILAGKLNITEFMLDKVPHYIVITGDNLTNVSRFSHDVERLCQAQRDVFGGLPDDLEHYWFLLWITEDGYGGLEHMQSTLLLSSRYSLPSPFLTDDSEPDDSYQDLLALCSHEYFHTWWVKRLKPAEFVPYRLSEEQYSRQLWLYEGFTSYFDDLALVRSGLISTERYLRTLEKTISRVTRNPSDSQQSLTDSSFNAWHKFYKQDENAVNSIVSYYAKGALLALCLDAELRSAGASLDAIVCQLWRQYRHSGTSEDALQQCLIGSGYAELAKLTTLWINSAEPLPLAQTLPKLGLALTFRAMQHSDDIGGELADGALPVPYLGMVTKTVNSVLQVTQVYNGGTAHTAGVMVSDVLLALDNRKLTAASLSQILSRSPLNTPLELTLFRKDRLLRLNIKLEIAMQQVAIVTKQDAALCQRWLMPLATLDA